MKLRGHMRKDVGESNQNHRKDTVLFTYWSQLLLAIVAISFAIIQLVPLEWEDHINVYTGVALLLCGLVFFTALYQGLNCVFLNTGWGRRFCKNYRLSMGVQAIFCCLTGAICICYSCPKDMMKTSHYISEAYAWFGAAYFLYDIFSMYIGHRIVKRTNSIRSFLAENAIIVGHHIFIGAFGFLVITVFRGGLGDCFFGFIYFMEASTPFVSVRGILSKMGLKRTRLYIVNGLIMLVVFLLCRILMFPFVIYLYSKAVHMTFLLAIESLPRGCKISILILLLPQLYWFYLMIRGALKVFRPQPKKMPLNSSNNNANNKKKTKYFRQ